MSFAINGSKVLLTIIVVQIISNLPIGCQCRNKLNKIKKWEIGNHFEGDIMLNNEDSQSAAIIGNHRRWPKAKIPYVIPPGHFSRMERRVIAQAMRDYHKYTCIRFIPRTKETDYLILQKTGDGCWSYIGRIRGNQTVSLDEGCVDKGTVLHELMHAAGFFHEQARTDRDDYVTIHWNNIQRGVENNFEKYDSSRIDLLKTKYDSKSIMHYGPNAFAINPSLPTISNKDGSPVKPNLYDFSKTDILELNRMYNCPNMSSSKTDDRLSIKKYKI